MGRIKLQICLDLIITMLKIPPIYTNSNLLPFSAEDEDDTKEFLLNRKVTIKEGVGVEEEYKIFEFLGRREEISLAIV